MSYYDKAFILFIYYNSVLRYYNIGMKLKKDNKTIMKNWQYILLPRVHVPL